MSDKKINIKCNLTTQGTDGANAKAISDLEVSDPEPEIGKQIIKDAIEDGDSKSGNS